MPIDVYGGRPARVRQADAARRRARRLGERGSGMADLGGTKNQRFTSAVLASSPVSATELVTYE